MDTNSSTSENKTESLTFTLDDCGRILSACPIAHELWPNLEGQFFLELITKNSSSIARGIKEVCRTGKSWQGAFFPNKKQGLDIFISPIPNGKMKVEINRQGYFTPPLINEHIELDNLNPLIQEKIKFLLRSSHNLRTPLTVIKSGLEFLEHEEVSPANRTLITNLIKEVNHFTPLLEKILWMSRIDVGVPIPMEEISLQPFLKNFIDKFSKLQGRKIHLKLPTKIISVKAERSALTEILTNLLENACKFCPKGKIEVEVKDGEKIVKCIVRDKGPGLNKEERQKIFERFYSNKSKANPKGTGLGLTIVKELVNLHGGDITLGNPNIGSEFIFTLQKWD